MIKCAKCGCENRFDGAVFCKDCGAHLGDQASASGGDKASGKLAASAAEEAKRQTSEKNAGENSAGEEAAYETPEQGAKKGQSEPDRIQIEDPGDFLQNSQKNGPAIPPATHGVLSDADKSQLLLKLQNHLATDTKPAKQPSRTSARKEAQAPITEESSSQLLSEPVKRDEPRVYANRNRLIFPKTTKLIAGDKVTYRDRDYQILPFKRDPKTLYLGGALLAIILVAMIVQGFRGNGSTKPTLFGVITDAASSEVLRGATVSIPDLELYAQTDDHGSFSFPDLKRGIYQIKIEKDNYASAFLPVTVQSDESSLLCTSLIPTSTPELLAEADAAEDDAAVKTEKKPKYGTLQIKTNVEDAEIVVNGKLLGQGNQTFKRMKPGNHVLQVKREGYQDFEQPITITPGKSTEVVALMDKVEEPGVPEFTAAEYMQQADDLFAEEKYVEAIGYYTLAIAKDNSLAEAYRRQAEANLKLGRSLKAQADLLAAAKIYAASGRYSEAISCYDRIIGFVPTSSAVFQRRGWARIYSGDFEAGITDMEAGLGLDEDNWQARFQLGKAFYFTGNYKSAEKHLKKIRKYETESSLINGYLALAYLGKGDESDARKYYHKFSEQAQQEDWDQMSSESHWQQLTALAQAEE